MEMPNKLCPMGFNRPGESKTESLCLGFICAWFDRESGSCAVAKPSVAAKPAAKSTKPKKATEG